MPALSMQLAGRSSDVVHGAAVPVDVEEATHYGALPAPEDVPENSGACQLEKPRQRKAAASERS